MTSNEILKADVLDILFDNRNKNYGAYSLRKNYNMRLGIALAIAISVIFLFLLLVNTSPSSNILNDIKHDVEVININIPQINPELPKPPQRSQVRPQVQQVSYANFKMVEQVDPLKEIAPISEARESALSNTNVTGIVNPDIKVVKNPETVKETGTGESNDKFAPVEKQPEFPGGMQAWINFLNRNLRVPDEMEPGDKKNVLVNFQVDVDGTVTGFKIVQSGGNVFDNEVIRVLKKMPKWKPAIQNGHAIAMQFTQPVTFVAYEQ